MDFTLSKQHLLLRDMYRAFAENEVKPLAEEVDEEERFPMETVKKLARYGFMGIPFPKKYGGAGGDVLAYAMAVEELSKACATTGVIVSAHTSLCCAPIYENGTEEQKMQYLPKLLSGEWIGAFGLTEPNAGTDASGQQTTAELVDDHYVLNGTKIFITNAGYAHVYIIFAMTDKKAGNKGISAFIVVFIIFFVLNLTPGNPGRSILGVSAPQEAVDQLNEELGYNDPLLVKYFNYLKNLVLNRSFGTSYFTGQAVADEVLPRFGVTLKLSTIGIIISTLVGVPLGILTAVKQYSIWDYVPSVLAFLLAAIPSFVLGMVLLFVFALKLNILPSYGLETWKCYIMPSLCMAIPITAFNVRFTKSSMLESIREDYIDTARAKGAKERTVIWKHALKNALLPVITNIGLNMGGLIMGAVVAERLFSVPGIGALIVDRIAYKDEPVIIAGTIVISITFTIIMLAVDIIYAFVDPRIRAKYTKVKG